MSQSRNNIPGSMSDNMGNSDSGPEAAGSRDGMTDLAGVAQRIKDTAGQAREFVSEKLTNVSGQLSNVGDQLSQGVDHIRAMEKSDYEEMWTGVKEKARENPGQTILVAAGVGFVLGLMMRMGGRR